MTQADAADATDEEPKAPRPPARVPVPFRMRPAGRDQMDEVAKEMGESRSEFIRQAVIERIQRHQRSKK